MVDKPIDQYLEFKALAQKPTTSVTLPKLRSSQPNQLCLDYSDLKLDDGKGILFQGDGQISAVKDLRFLTGSTTTPALTIFANGTIGIITSQMEVAGKILATELKVNGTVKATSFIGEFPGLTEKVSKAGDTMTGLLAIGTNDKPANLTVSGRASIGKDANQTNLTVIGTVSATKFEGDGSGLKNVGIASQWVGDKHKISFEGNVGIGTTAAEVKLQVAGNFQLERGVPVNEFVSDLSTFNGNPSTSVPTLALLEKAIDDLKKQFQQELEAVKKESEEVKQELTSAKQEIESLQNNIKSLQTQNQLLQQQNQSLTTDLQNIKNELNQLVKWVRPASVIAFNANNEWIALKAGQYNVGDLESMGIGNDRLTNLLVPPKWKVFCYKDANYQSNPIHIAGPYSTWGFVPNWLEKQISSIKIQTA